jgi:hypothetical protein
MSGRFGVRSCGCMRTLTMPSGTPGWQKDSRNGKTASGRKRGNGSPKMLWRPDIANCPLYWTKRVSSIRQGCPGSSCRRRDCPCWISSRTWPSSTTTGGSCREPTAAPSTSSGTTTWSGSSGPMSDFGMGKRANQQGQATLYSAPDQRRSEELE